MNCVNLLILICLLSAVCIVTVFAAGGHGDHGGAAEEEEETEKGMELDENGVFCKVLEHSGKIMCTRPPKGIDKDLSDKNTERVIIEMDEVQERRKDGNSVKKSGGKSHKFNSFATKEFTFTEMAKTTYQGLSVKTLNVSAMLEESNAHITIMMYMFGATGNITFGNETYEIRQGMLKFNIVIKNWAFCSANASNCDNSDEGEYIDFAIAIKSKGKPKRITEEEEMPESKGMAGMDHGDHGGGAKEEEPKRRPRCVKKGMHPKCPKEFDIGGGSEIVLNTQVMVDDEIVDMPGNGDFPKFMEMGNKQKFIFRFPKAGTILYDPGLELAEESRGSLIVQWSLGCVIFVATLVIFLTL